MKEPLLTVNMADKYVFDTSAINRLLEDRFQERLVHDLKQRNVLPTTLSVTEICCTEHPVRRSNLLRLLKSIGRDKRPIAAPNQLIIRACSAFARREGLMLNDGEEEDGAWFALNNPTAVDEEDRRLALEYKNGLENSFRKMHEHLRADFERIFASGTTRPRTARELIDHYNKNDDFLYDTINPIYERATGSALPRAELRYFLDTIPHVRLFLMAYAMAVFQRAVREQGFGHKRNPGNFDLWSAAYLPSCDLFVTDDTRQRRALRILGAHEGYQSRVVSHRQLKQSLVQ